MFRVLGIYNFDWDVAFNAGLYIASDNLWLGLAWPVKIDAIQKVLSPHHPAFILVLINITHMVHT